MNSSNIFLNVPGIHQTYFLMFQEFINHFYKNVLKLIDRAMRKEDNSPQAKQLNTKTEVKLRKKKNVKNSEKTEVTISKKECKNYPKLRSQ
jgi:hypothetical protein